jgi:hypothetical protein
MDQEQKPAFSDFTQIELGRKKHENFTGMFLGDESTVSQTRVLREITDLGLEQNAWELDTKGYTVLRPDQVGAADLITNVKDHALSIIEQQIGFRLDLDEDQRFAGAPTPVGRGAFIPLPILMDQMYEPALMNRAMLALVTYLLGESCILSSMSIALKVQAPEILELHTDNVGMPSPMAPYPQVANATWALTDYSPENGATQFLPGSHRRYRQPCRAEALDLSLAVPVTAPAGSIIIWNGATWHGAVPRTNSGARLSLIMLFCRWYLMPQMMMRQLISEEAVTRNPPRFATLVGKRSPYSGLETYGPPVGFTLGQSSQFA